MVGFYVWERLVRGTAEAAIWTESYFAPHWQDVFDLFNSIPLVALALVVSHLLGAQRGVWLCASMLLHIAFDLPLHHDDAHRHFYPLSDWRFESPLSYWDPRYHGRWFGLAEMAGVALGGVYLWRTRPTRTMRALVAAFVGTYLLFIGFAVPQIDNAAHIGGLLAGAWLGFVLVPEGARLGSFWNKPASVGNGPNSPDPGSGGGADGTRLVRVGGVLGLVGVIVALVLIGPITYDARILLLLGF